MADFCLLLYRLAQNGLMSFSVLLFNSKSSPYLKLQLCMPQPKRAAWNSIRRSGHGLQLSFWVMKSFTPFDGDVLANESVIWDWWEHFTQRDEPSGEQNCANLWLSAPCCYPRWFPVAYNETSYRAHSEWSTPPWRRPTNDTKGCDNSCLVPTCACKQMGLLHVIQRRREGGRVTQNSRLQ